MDLTREDKIILLVAYAVMLPTPAIFLVIGRELGGFQQLSFSPDFVALYLLMTVAFATYFGFGSVYVRHKSGF